MKESNLRLEVFPDGSYTLYTQRLSIDTDGNVVERRDIIQEVLAE